MENAWHVMKAEEKNTAEIQQKSLETQRGELSVIRDSLQTERGMYEQFLECVRAKIQIHEGVRVLGEFRF